VLWCRPFYWGNWDIFYCFKDLYIYRFSICSAVVFYQIWALYLLVYMTMKRSMLFHLYLYLHLCFAWDCLCIFVVIPFGFQFLWAFAGNVVNFLQTLDEYIGIFTKILFGLELLFELPVILFSWCNWVNRMIKTKRLLWVCWLISWFAGFYLTPFQDCI